MSGMERYVFEGGEFARSDEDPAEGATEEEQQDWERCLCNLGWDRYAVLPEHEGSDFAVFQIHIHYHSERGVYLIEVLFEDRTVMQVYTTSTPELFRFLRDWFYPLSAHADRDHFTDAAMESIRCLFDEQYGLACAQRYKTNQRRLTEYYRREEERRRKEKEKSEEVKT